MYFPREFFSSSGENVSVSQLEGYHNLQHSRDIVLLLLVGNCKDGTRSSKQGQGQMIINHRLSSSPQQRALFPLPQESCRNGEKRYLPPLRLRYKSFIFWRCRLFIVAFSFFSCRVQLSSSLHHHLDNLVVTVRGKNRRKRVIVAWTFWSFLFLPRHLLDGTVPTCRGGVGGGRGRGGIV